MVVTLGPGKFYGNSLPRPYFYADTKHNGDGPRVDPPVPVLDPLLSWASDAHWSMGGLSFKRHRLQGRIEGSIKRLRKQEMSKERRWKKQERLDLAKAKKERTARMQRLAKLVEEEEDVDSSEEEQEDVKEENLVLESEEEEEDGDDEEDNADVAAVAPSRRPNKRVRKLEDEFDKVASADWGSKAPCLSVRNTRASTRRKRTQASPSPPPPPVAAAATPTRRWKAKNAVVTLRRSSRISPGKKSGSV